MNLIKCENNHYFDIDKFNACPHCANQVAQSNTIDIMAKDQGNINTSNKVTKNTSTNTLSLLEHRLVVGWLVCTQGNMRGKSFCLYEGFNYIGRAANMDVALTQEPNVSRECHAQVIYDKDSNRFSLLVTEEHIDTTAYNHTKLKADKPKQLKARDSIQIGDCDLTFIPFCGKQFTWSAK